MKLLTKELRVLVSTPSDEFVRRRFHLCMMQMMAYFMSHKVVGYDSQAVIPQSIKDSILCRARWNAVVEAVQQNASHLLFIDSDQTFPRDLIERLVAHEVDCVAANVATKQIPAQPTARQKSGAPVFTDDKRGLEKVWRVGTGIMLLRMASLRKFARGSMFEVRWLEEHQRHMGEDWSMVAFLEENGIDVWVDHDLSRQVGHLGEFEYTHDVVGEIVKGPERGHVVTAG